MRLSQPGFCATHKIAIGLGRSVTPDELYEKGYSDGFHEAAANASLVDEPNYKLGYNDGTGDRERGSDVKGVKSAFIDPEFYENNMPPQGYSWTWDHRTPQKGEIYLTKNGNAGVAKEPKQQRNRHILKADDPCQIMYWAEQLALCKLAKGHKGKCSWALDH